MSKLQRYSSYKESGVEWVGEIPEHWEIKKLKYTAKIVLGKMLCNENKKNYQLKPYLKSKNIQWLNVDISSIDEMWFSQAELIEYRLHAGDLILSEGGEVGKTCIWNDQIEECYIQNSAHKVTIGHNCNARYYLYQFFTIGKIGLFDSIVNRVSIAHLTKDKLSSVDVIVPPKSEQTAIASFLDEKIAQIDQAISQKEKMIELLKERRQIVINEAVTRGINPNTPMKESGVAWIGEIPKHWEVKKLKFVVIKIGSGITPSGGALSYLTEGIPLLRSQNILFEKIDYENSVYISEKTHNKMKNSQVKYNDVLLNITGGSIGRCNYVDVHYPLNVNQHVCIIRPTNKIFTILLNNILASEVGQSQIWRFQQGGGREGLNFETIKNFDIPLPPKDEQLQIVAYIEEQTAKIDRVIDLQRNYIDKLKEYKATLIDSVVTGKVRVA